MKLKRSLLYFIALASSAFLPSCGLPISVSYNAAQQTVSFTKSETGGISLAVEAAK